jgi:UDP-glucose 4-epimerase
MRFFVTGGAGFIGSQLVDKLLSQHHQVVCYDNFSTGFVEFIQEAKKSSSFRLIHGDLLNRDLLQQAMNKCDAVFHFAANADVRFGTDHPHKDLEQNALATFNVLEAMRSNQIKKIVFASTGSIYGEATVIPTPENAPFPIQTSLYGASKLAAESLIQAYCDGFNFQSYIFRFVSILGERYTHGHVFDFYNQLLKNPQQLTILGNGRQRKSYLYIQDCLEAIAFVMEHAHDKINIFNLGTDEYCEVNDSIQWICDYLKLTPERTYTGGTRGWIGDNPFIFLDCSKLKNLGFTPKLSIRDSIIRTIQFLQHHQWVLSDRSKKDISTGVMA